MSRPHNLLDLVGRRADSFSREDFAALPELTSFTKSYLVGTAYQERNAWTKTAAGWVCGVFSGETHDADVVLSIPDLVCIAVGEPARGDTVHALSVLDVILPRPTAPLHARAAELQRRPRMSVADCEEVFELTYRLSKLAQRAGCDLSLAISHRAPAQIQVVGAVPDLIGATKAPHSDHLHATDAAGTLMMWRQ
jgi:hypothetical protein